MKFPQPYFATSSRASKWLVFLCLILVLVTASVQSMHLHPAGTETKDCSLCQVATSTIVALLVVLLLVVVRTIAPLHHSEEADPVAVFASFSLFSRPPPVAV